MRAVEGRGPARHREQVAAVQDPTADVPPGVELRDDAAAVAPGDGRGGVEGRGEGCWYCGTPTGCQGVPMDYTHLGRSGLSVSRLCLGTMNFG